jgi:hypothetical protein
LPVATTGLVFARVTIHIPIPVTKALRLWWLRSIGRSVGSRWRSSAARRWVRGVHDMRARFTTSALSASWLLVRVVEFGSQGTAAL